MLQRSLDELKASWEFEKEKVVGYAVAAYLWSEAFNDETMKYFISGLETLHRRILWVCPDLDLSMLKADVESDFVGPKATKEVEEELEKDDVTS